MNFFDFFKKRKAKHQTLCSSFSFDPFPVEAYRNYEFDTENSLVTCGNEITFGSGNKVKNNLNVLKDGTNSQMVYSVLNHAARHPNTSDAECVSSEKAAKNIYAITMRNCKYFHIGPQRTINVTSNEHLKKDWLLKENFNTLLDSYERIPDVVIMMISLHIGRNWKKFGTSLGLDKNYLEELSYRNDTNEIILSFDILQKYLTLFPNTTIGFIVNVLHEIQEEKIIKEIVENIIM